MRPQVPSRIQVTITTTEFVTTFIERMRGWNPQIAIEALTAQNARQPYRQQNSSQWLMRIVMHSAFLLSFACSLPAQSSSLSDGPPTQGLLSVLENGSTADGDSSPPIVTIHNTLGIASGAPIGVRLNAEIDSASAVNGQQLQGKLVKAAGTAPAGSPVELTVVAVAAAGRMFSAGELSLQIVRINGKDELSQVITMEGKQGARLTADAAPAQGTEASISPEQTLIFPAY